MALPYEEARGEAAFYGPKIDLQVQDPQGREETLSTVQVDFHLPARFQLAAYDGDRQVQPVMVHRSIVSTMERMVAHLLEVHEGALPVWLSPCQVRLLPVVDEAIDYSFQLRDRCRAAGLRANVDHRESTLGARVRDAERDRVPFIAVLGQREVDGSTVAVRRRDGRRLGPTSVDEFVALVSRAAQNREG
jgi:threonyl-tRNA synthetase